VEFNLNNEEKRLIIEAIQGHLNNPKTAISYDELTKLSELKEKIRFFADLQSDTTVD
jgi:hypothetical protein